jgi:hypothetical protein
MAKRPERSKQPEPQARPDEDLVRYTALMRREDRHRLRVYCVRVGEDMERLGAAWIMERLAQEERKLPK